MQGRVFFNTDLFPEGHKLARFVWTARLIPNSGIYFDFDIQSETYCTEYDDNLDKEEPKLWESKGMWANAGNCRINSPTEQANGFLVGSDENLFSFEQLNFTTYNPDPIDPIDDYWENLDHCFDAHILSFDFIGGNTIKIQKQEPGLYSIHWTGEIALANWKDFEFEYKFLVEAKDVKFNGIRFPARLSIEETWEELKKYVVDINLFKVVYYFQQDTSFFPEPRFVPLGS